MADSNTHENISKKKGIYTYIIYRKESTIMQINRKNDAVYLILPLIKYKQ